MRKRAAAFLTALAMMIAGAFSGSAETPAEIGTAAPSDPLAQYRAELEDTAESVAFCRGTRPMLTLLVFSDLHEDPESPEPKALDDMLACMAELIGEIHPDAIFNLGDLIYGERYPLGQAIPQIAGLTEKFRRLGVPYYNLLGNHDDLSGPDPVLPGGIPETDPLTVDDLYETLLSGNPGAVFSAARKTDFYVDFGEVRVICLSAAGAAFQPETADWLRREALDTDREVLVLSHCPTRPEWGYFADVTGGELIEDALREFSARGGTVLAYIHGHDHGDMTETAEDLPYTGVSVGCARISQPKKGTEGIVYQPRNPADETRLLFDVVLIDSQAERVRLIRFGAGENRMVTTE